MPVSGLEPRPSYLKSGALPRGHGGRGRAIRYIHVNLGIAQTLSLVVRVGDVKVVTLKSVHLLTSGTEGSAS